MYLFLTSSPCDNNVPTGVDLPCIFFKSNHFVENLQKCIKPGARFVVVASDPDNYPLNDEMTQTFASCFRYHGMPFSSVELCDARTEAQVSEMIARSDVIMIGGGHVPTQNAFLERLSLRNHLANYNGVVMGVSAGSMNCASTVYAQPEMPGESIDPDYRRFIPGLNLTDVMILPHYQETRHFMLDGKRLFEDITYADSYGRKFIAIPDASYVLVEQGRATLYGEGYLISDGEITQICNNEECISLQ